MIIDFFWIGGTIVLALGLGIYFGRKQKSVSDYFLGGGQLPWPALALSIVATETSTLTFIGIPAMAYSGNWGFLQVAIGYIIGRYLVAMWLLPKYWRGDILSAYGYIRERLGPGVGKTTSGIFIITRTLADGVRLYATALPIMYLLDIPLLTALLLIALVTILYTFWGGLKAVVWMDVIQFAFYVIAGTMALYFALQMSGLSEVNALWAYVASSPKTEIFNWSEWNGYGFGLAVLGGMVLTFGSHGTDQIIVQRLLAAGNIVSAQKALKASGWLVLLQFILFLLLGSVIFIILQDPHWPYSPKTANDILPWFITYGMPDYLRGFIVAGVLAAAMSSLSSSLNALASATVGDFNVKLGSKRSAVTQSRLVSLIWGLILIIPALAASEWGNVLEVGLGIAAYAYIFLIFVFIVSIQNLPKSLWIWLSPLMAMIIVWVLTQQVFSLHWLWRIPIGTVIAFCIYAIAVLFSRKDSTA
jgi:SSS family solute:Na+ symporter